MLRNIWVTFCLRFICYRRVEFMNSVKDSFMLIMFGVSLSWRICSSIKTEHYFYVQNTFAGLWFELMGWGSKSTSLELISQIFPVHAWAIC